MQSDLHSLLTLQEKDRVVMQVEEELRALEPELANFDEVVSRLEHARDEALRGLEEAQRQRAETEERIENYKVMQERRRQKLEWVRGAKEASALMAEIDLARSVLAKEEAEWIRSADLVEEAELAAQEAEAALEAERETQAPRRDEIAGVRSECEGRLASAQKERQGATKDVTRSMLALYDRIRQGRAPLALYELHASACGHCYTAVPMHLRQQIERGATVATCEACGVIMYAPEE